MSHWPWDGPSMVAVASLPPSHRILWLSLDGIGGLRVTRRGIIGLLGGPGGLTDIRGWRMVRDFFFHKGGDDAPVQDALEQPPEQPGRSLARKSTVTSLREPVRHQAGDRVKDSGMNLSSFTGVRCWYGHKRSPGGAMITWLKGRTTDVGPAARFKPGVDARAAVAGKTGIVACRNFSRGGQPGGSHRPLGRDFHGERQPGLHGPFGRGVLLGDSLSGPPRHRQFRRAHSGRPAPLRRPGY